MKIIASLLLALSFATFSLAQNQSASKPLTLNGVTALSVTTSSLPSFFVGKAYTATLAAAGGVTPYTWAVTGGSLPNGLALSAAGVLSGTPTALCAVNPCSFTVTVTDSSSTVATIKLQWQPSPTKTVAGYNVYQGSATPPTTKLTNTNAATLTATTQLARGSGTKFFAVEAFDTNGLKAALSNIIAVTP